MGDTQRGQAGRALQSPRGGAGSVTSNGNGGGKQGSTICIGSRKGGLPLMGNADVILVKVVFFGRHQCGKLES
eukprot:scaffold581909_cov24-Prasinocladus_malaysianus.AAC.1